MGISPQTQPAAAAPRAQPDIASMSLESRIEAVVKRAAAKLPAEVGRQLLTLIEPQSLAIIASVVVVWAGSQFFGVGEVADAVLIVAGWVAFGTVAFSAGHELIDFATETENAKTEADMDRAADHLARAITLLGVQTVLVLLLRRPRGALREQYMATPGNPNPLPRATFDNLPNNRWWGYKPSVTGNPRLAAGVGGTDVVTGDIEYSLAGTLQDQQLALVHETVHQILTPKLNLLRGLRGFLRAQGYNRSYILRYLEEALAETVAQMRVKGIIRANVIEGLRFPVANGYVTVAKIGEEARGLLLGPVIVGGQVFNVWYAER